MSLFNVQTVETCSSRSFMLGGSDNCRADDNQVADKVIIAGLKRRPEVVIEEIKTGISSFSSILIKYATGTRIRKKRYMTKKVEEVCLMEDL